MKVRLGPSRRLALELPPPSSPSWACRCDVVVDLASLLRCALSPPVACRCGQGEQFTTSPGSVRSRLAVNVTHSSLSVDSQVEHFAPSHDRLGRVASWPKPFRMRNRPPRFATSWLPSHGSAWRRHGNGTAVQLQPPCSSRAGRPYQSQDQPQPCTD